MENENNCLLNDTELDRISGGDSAAGTCPDWHQKGRTFWELESAVCPTPEKKGAYTSGMARCASCAKR